ncbi:hypothetical protein J0910_01920 [Nocardiopsis sp. CNT-189]|uniref:endonuclease/exonuclease/phosphatase family protein n=1 Tax=Nocardiopsis oceanisediminis TaxID=2816862 RepID=UPI003B2980A6
MLAIVLAPPAQASSIAQNAPAERPPAASESFSVLSFNMAGGWACLVLPNDECKGNYPDAPYDEERDNAVPALAESIRARDTKVALIQEACRDWIEDELPAELGKEYRVGFEAFSQQGEDGVWRTPGCKTAGSERGPDYGIGIVVHEDFGDVTFSSRLLDSGEDTSNRPERKKMLCAHSAELNAVACSIHLQVGREANEVEVRESQAESAMEYLAERFPGQTKIIGGDINAEAPHSGTEGGGTGEAGTDPSLEHFYHLDYTEGAEAPAHHGAYKEAFSGCGDDMGAGECMDGPLTRPNYLEKGEKEGLRPLEKIDYVFVSEWVEVKDTKVTAPRHSDHKLLWADVEFPANAGQSYVDTIGNLKGWSSPYENADETGLLNGGTPYVYCRQWGREIKGERGESSWWVLTDLDEGDPWRLQWVSAYGLVDPGDADDLPLCAGSFSQEPS